MPGRWFFLIFLALSLIARPPLARAAGVSSLVISEFMASNSQTLADGEGDYSDWIEIHNPTAAAVAVTGCYLSDDATNPTKWQFPAAANISVPANGYLIVFASDKASGTTPYVDAGGRIHTTFKLSADGEDLLLVASDGTTVISSYLDFPAQTADVSYGLGSNSVVGFFGTPTPGAANGAAGDDPQVADTKFSVKRGFYTTAFSLEITCATAGASIRYTLDSSTPTSVTGTLYTGAITISGTTVVRAIAYKTGYLSTNVDTQTYLFIANTIAQPATRPTTSWPSPTTGSNSTQAIDYGMDTDVTQSSLYADQMDDALLAIPSISLVTDLPNLFNSSTGIYANPGGEGETWERPASVELILPSGEEGFQVDSGIRIRGGVSASKSNPKHSFRVIMRSEYGDSKINYPLFGEDGPSSFDKIDLRTAQNFSWNYSSPAYCNFLDDPFTRDTMGALGHPYTRGFFFHLYLDGEYWGLYQTEERPDAYFGETYLGGNEDDYDVVKSDEDNGQMYAVDGDTTFYNAFWTLQNAGVSTAAAYFQLQGLNTDGTRNTSYPRYLDADNLIDYMLLVFFTGAGDMPLGPPNSNSMPRNLYAFANRVDQDGFKYLPHDNEWSLNQQIGVNINKVSVTLGSTLGTQVNFNPWWLHQRLKTNTEYKMRLADRIHKHFFNGGALTPTACVARYQKRIDEINLAIIAESARWGDTLSSSSPRTRNTDWLPQVTWARDTFLGSSSNPRTTIVLNQLKSAGLYPTVAAPEFSQFGGSLGTGGSVTISAAAGTIYYTTDGSDPRVVGGTVLATASSGSSGVQVPLASSATLKARAYSGGTWSALTEADFTVETTPETAVRLSEWQAYQ